MGWLDEFWRDAVAVTGLLVSLAGVLIGFPIAIYEIWRSRGAAEAAERAVNETRAAISRNLAAVDLERASNMIDEIRNLHRLGKWEVALYRYRDNRRMLSDVRARYPDLTPEQQNAIKEAVTHLQTLDRRVAEAEQTDSAPQISGRDEEYLQKVQSTLDDLASGLKQQVQVGGD